MLGDTPGPAPYLGALFGAVPRGVWWAVWWLFGLAARKVRGWR